MLSLQNYLIYCGIFALVIATPGPGMVAVVARALGAGFRSAVPSALGTLIGHLIWMTLAVFGLAAVAKAMGSSFLVLKYAGAAYLIYMGYKYWTAEVSEMPEVAAATARQSFFSQLSVTLGNPKAMAFYLAVLPTVVSLKQLTAAGYLQLAIASAVVIPAITLGYAALASQVRNLLMSRRARKGINKTAAVVMVGAGAGVATS